MGIFAWLGENPLFTALTGICSIVGIIGWLLSIRKKQLIVTYSCIRIYKDSRNVLNKIDMLYDGRKIDTLSITRIVFWNQFGTLLYKDIAPADQIRIHPSGSSTILDVGIIAATNEANQASICKDTGCDSYSLSFNHFEARDGVVIQVFHTGDDNLNISGKIIGGKAIRLSVEPQTTTAKAVLKHNMFFISSLLIALCLVLTCLAVMNVLLLFNAFNSIQDAINQLVPSDFSQTASEMIHDLFKSSSMPSELQRVIYGIIIQPILTLVLDILVGGYLLYKKTPRKLASAAIINGTLL